MNVVDNSMVKYRGLSTDTKPAAAPGSEFLEMDTGKFFMYDGSAWKRQPASGAFSLLAVKKLGTLSTSSTTSTTTNKSLTVKGYEDYDVLVVEVSVDTPTKDRHTSTVSMIYLTGTSNVNTKNTYTVGSNKWNSKLDSGGTGITNQSTTGYGIYANSASVDSNTMTIPLYYRYSSNSTGTINGDYTARVYGLKLYDLIGG